MSRLLKKQRVDMSFLPGDDRVRMHGKMPFPDGMENASGKGTAEESAVPVLVFLHTNLRYHQGWTHGCMRINEPYIGTGVFSDPLYFHLFTADGFETGQPVVNERPG